MIQRIRVDNTKLTVSHCLQWLAVGLAVTTLTTVAIAAPQVNVLILAAAIVSAFTIYLTRLDLAELLIITLPITFYISLGTKINFSVADIVLVMLIFKTALNTKSQTPALGAKGFQLFICCMSLFLIAATSIGVVNSPSPTGPSWLSYFLDAFKWITVTAYLLVAFSVFRQKFERKDWRFLRIWTYTAMTTSLLGIAGVIIHEQGIETPLAMDYRATGTFEDPNAFAAYLLASIGVTLVSNAVRGARLLSWHVVPIMLALYLTYSRAAIIVAILMAILILFLSCFHKEMKGLRVVIVAFTASAGVAFLLGALGRSIEGRREAALEEDIRFQLWSAAVTVWQQNPLFGVGLGQYRDATNEILRQPVALLAHNTYLSFLAEGGAIGLLLFLLMIAAVLRRLLARGGLIAALLTLSIFPILAMAFSLNLQFFRPLWVVLAVAAAWSFHDPDSGNHETPADKGYAIKHNLRT